MKNYVDIRSDTKKIYYNVYAFIGMMKTDVKKIIIVFFVLLELAGIGNFVYFMGFDDGYDEYKSRIDLLDEDRVVLTYYFFWYDNNSGGPVQDSLHMYNNPETFAPTHPYYMENSSLLNSSYSIPTNDYLAINVTDLNEQKPVDFDLLQSYVVSDSDNFTIFGLNNIQYSLYTSDQNGDYEKFGLLSGNDSYHRLDYRRKEATWLIIENDNIGSINIDIKSTVHNDSNSHHPDGNKFQGDFSYDNVYWHKYEIEQIMKAGIDVIMPVYWASWCGEWNTIGMEKFIEAYELLELEFGLEALPKIGMFMDTTALMVYGGDAINLTSDNGKAVFSLFINEFYDFVPDNYLFQYQGKEIVWMYTSNFIEEYNDDTFTNARTNYTAHFGVGKDIIFIGSGFRENASDSMAASYTWGVSLNGATIRSDGIKIGCVGPGFYSEGALRHGWQITEGLRVQDRRNGDYYSESFREVMTGSKWVVIEVWNEYHEGNDISYTEEYKDLYINLTASLVEEFKNSKYIDFKEIDIYNILTLIVGIALVAVILMERKNKNKLLP